MAALIATSTGWYITSLQLDNCQIARKNDKTAYEKAQATALATELKKKQDKIDEYERKRIKADADLATLTGKYHAAVLRYQTAKGTPNRVSAPSETKPAEGDNGPGGETVVSVADLMVCADNTARLEVAREWALGL